MRPAIAIVSLSLLAVGCSTKEEQKPWNEPAAWRPGTPPGVHYLYPDDNERWLATDQQKEKLAQFRLEWSVIDLATPFDADPVLRSLYIEWYGKGYTFYEATSMKIIPPQYDQPDSQEQRVKAAGWQAGELAARLRQIEGLGRQFEVGQPGTGGNR